MKEKIVCIIYNPQIKKFLLLKTNKNNYHASIGDWFTINDDVKENFKIEESVKISVKEQTGLDIFNLISLNWGSIYFWEGKETKEIVFFGFAQDTKKDTEKNNYLWTNLIDFIGNIKWKENKRLLKQIIEKTLEGRLFFNKVERGQ